MAILSLDNFYASTKQPLNINKTSSRTSVALSWFSLTDIAGNPGAGTLAGASTTAGVVPTSATAGMPVINAFGGGATGYLAQLEFGNTVAARHRLSDMLFKAGPYSFNSAVALAAQPSFSSRVPGGTDYNDCQLWFECVTAFTGTPTIQINYTNNATAGRTTSAISLGFVPTVGRRVQLPLASGDGAPSKIESVTGTVATAGTFNILVMKPLSSFRARYAGDGDVYGYDRLGGPVVYSTSALDLMVNADSTSTGLPEIEFVIANL